MKGVIKWLQLSKIFSREDAFLSAFKEFENRHVRELFANDSIELFSIKSTDKSAFVKHFNRTLKNKPWRYLVSSNQRKWLNV